MCQCCCQEFWWRSYPNETCQAFFIQHITASLPCSSPSLWSFTVRLLINTRLSGIYCWKCTFQEKLSQLSTTKMWGITSLIILPRNHHAKLTAGKSEDPNVLFECTHCLINIVKSKAFTLNSKAFCKKIINLHYFIMIRIDFGAH